MSNPLLDFSGLPRFGEISPEHVQPAIQHLLVEANAVIMRLSQSQVPATWSDFVMPLDNALENLSRAWGVVAHLHAVNDVPEWRVAYNDMLPEVTRFYALLGQNLAVFEKYKMLLASAEYTTLSKARQRVIEHQVRDFRLAGADLADEQKPRFQAVQEELAALQAKFAENLLDATNAYVETVNTDSVLSGLPTELISAARLAAERLGVTGWCLGLQAPVYGPVMQYADDRALRARMYRAYATRASELGSAVLDNSAIMCQILNLRAEEARLLGYANFAALSLVPKMAESSSQVLAFLRDLASKAKPYAERELNELRAFALGEFGLDKLEAWDVAWVSEKLLQKNYAFSEQDIKPYFTVPKVLAGLFLVIEKLFSVRVKPDTAPVWHPEVHFYRVETAQGVLLGQFYLDLYARPEKRGGAWMDGAISRRVTPCGLQTPVAYLNCNFTPPLPELDGVLRPSTLTHDEVMTLFHEMGHGLHHLLTRVDESAVAGIHGVEWDAVELPSQFMENYCWEWSVLEGMSGHVEDGSPLPYSLFEKMRAARNFLAGLRLMRQIEMALFDWRLHQEFSENAACGILDVLKKVRDEVAVLTPPDWQRFPHSFSHVFAGGYAAGYYSYLWAEVLSADCYAVFETADDPFDVASGRRFLDEILSQGAVRSALESFKAFRGRPPQVDALLRQYGLLSGEEYVLA